MNTLQDYVIEFARFLNDIILPILFGFAFLVFLINLVRYFIIGGASDSEREKAKRSAIYGIAAFVLLFSTWTIVSLILQGVRFTETEADCPDYISAFGGSGCRTLTDGNVTQGIFPGSTPVPGSGSGGNGGGGSTPINNPNPGNNTGDGSSSDDDSNDDNEIIAGLAELVFGSGKDTVSSRRNLTSTTGSTAVPTISAAASCEAGFSALQADARTANTQAAYMYYQNADLSWQWQNVTDSSGLHSIGYDQDVIEGIRGTAGIENMYLIHTHPAERATSLDLTMSGIGPSAADMTFMCLTNDSRITHVVVDRNHLWSFTEEVDTCPYTAAAQTDLPSLETYLALSTLSPTERPLQLNEYIKSNLTALSYDQEFAVYSEEDLLDYSDSELRALSQTIQSKASTTIKYYSSVGNFCNSI